MQMVVGCRFPVAAEQLVKTLLFLFEITRMWLLMRMLSHGSSMLLLTLLTHTDAAVHVRSRLRHGVDGGNAMMS